MTKLTKQQSKLHLQALDMVHSDKVLTWDERKFILDNYFEAQGQLNALAGAFFTPFDLASDLSIEVDHSRKCGCSIVDLCAGIGMLSFACEYRGMDITCVEFCPEYVVVGKRVMPSAHWIEADVFKADLSRYTFAISNPPFGAIKGDEFKGRYTGGQFEYKVIELASRVAEYGVFILPQQSAPFRYSGAPCYRQEETDKCRKFWQQTGINMESSCGIDTSIYVSEWKGVSPICEVVCCDFTELAALQAEMDAESGARSDLPAEASPIRQVPQAGLFADEPLSACAQAPKTRRQRLDRKTQVERKARMAL